MPAPGDSGGARETAIFGLVLGFCFAIGYGLGRIAWAAILLNLMDVLG